MPLASELEDRFTQARFASAINMEMSRMTAFLRFPRAAA